MLATYRRAVPAIVLALISAVSARAANDASVPGRLIEERPTLVCLGVRWYVKGDANRNARVEVRYRASGRGEWRHGLDLFRTGPSWAKHTAPAEGEHLFAGSVFGLAEGTEYELELDLVDPDGGSTKRTLRMTTKREPRAPARFPLRILHVTPGNGGGSGALADPFKGLADASGRVRPGDLVLVKAGVYEATWTVEKSGTPELPIVWRGAADGESIIDGGHHEKPPERGVSMSGIHDVWLEDLIVRNVVWGVVNHEGQRTVFRRLTTHDTTMGFTATRHLPPGKPCLDIYISDCRMTGPSQWPRSKGIESARGIQIVGLGHTIRYNHISGFADAIDTMHSTECSAIDIYRNDVECLTDDGIECDYSNHNVRCFENRLTNVFQGISTQPTYGGPVYIFRNVLYNVGYETFKMHNKPTGALFFHNTSVREGMPLMLMTGAPVTNFVTRNNIFIGTKGNYGYESVAPMVECDFDYDGFGGEWGTFIKWNKKRIKTMAELENGPVYRHAVRLDPAATFAKKDACPVQTKTRYEIARNDLRLDEGSRAIDAGTLLHNINDGFAGDAPDLGAYELGAPVPRYGPRDGK